MTTKLRLFAFLLMGSWIPVQAQIVMDMASPAEVSGITALDPSIPTPEAILGAAVGQYPFRPDEIERYFRVLADVSPRMTLREHAVTVEGRTLFHVVVTAPANHAQLDEIAAQNRRLSDTPGDVDDASLSEMPVVVYQGFSVHGNEASGADAAVQYAYLLAAAQGPLIEEALSEAVLIVDPMFNPDGRDRFVDDIRRWGSSPLTTDDQDREHNESWPNGRTNHYWFDLNRDWLPARHNESQGRLSVFHHWRPQVLTDHHEMGGNASFFFQPGIPSRTNPYTPSENVRLTQALGTFHAQELDGINALYFTEESYDDYYYGKGSTYPDVQGAIGILFEQGSSRSRATQTQWGTLTYGYTVRNQFLAAVSTLRGSLALRRDLTGHMRSFYAGAVPYAERSGDRYYVVGTSADPTRATALVDILSRHRIEVAALGSDLRVGTQTFQAGDLVIDAHQPQSRLIRAIMDPVSSFTDSLFYDVSTWHFPSAFDFSYATLTRVSNLRDWSAPTPSQPLDAARDVYAYAIPWSGYTRAAALHELIRAGIKVYAHKDPFSALTTGGTSTAFDDGAMIIPMGVQEVGAADIERVLRAVQSAYGTRVVGVTSGLTPVGTEIGARDLTRMAVQDIALLIGPGVDTYATGEIWYWLNEAWNIPVSLLDTRSLDDAELSRYQSIIMTGRALPSASVDQLTSFVRQGGNLVLAGDATVLGQIAGWLPVESVPFNLDSLTANVPYAERSTARGAHEVGGVILSIAADQTHPLWWGEGTSAHAVFRQGSTFLAATASGQASLVASFSENPRLSGYLSKPRTEQIAGSAAIMVVRKGRGSVVSLGFEPVHRAYWYGTAGLLGNAIMLSPLW